MKPKIIKTKEEYEAALKKMEGLMDATPGSPEEEALELWSLLVDRYEEIHHPIDPPDPVEAIRFRMEQEGLRQKDLQNFLPTKSRISEVLNRKRPLSLSMIRSLHRGLGIPTDILVREAAGPYGKRSAPPKKAVVSSRKEKMAVPTKKRARRQSTKH